MMPPGPADLLAAGVTSPMAQCKVVSSWLVIVLGLALPAAVLWHLERQWRAAGQRQQRQQQQRQELPASEAAVDETARWRAGASAYLFSATTWLVACAAYGDTL